MDHTEDIVRALTSPYSAFVVGTGVSIAASGARESSWVGLLSSLADQTSKYQSPRVIANNLKKIQSGKVSSMIRAADNLVKCLGGRNSTEFRHWLFKTVGTIKAKNPHLLRLICDARKLILTTNYDSLLENESGLKAVPWTDSDQVADTILTKQGIIHLHGHFETPSSVVLGAESYSTLTNDSQAQALQRAVGTLSSLIFVGCGSGLEDPNFGPFMEWARKIKGSSAIPWFILCTEQEAASIKKRWNFLIATPYGRRHEDLPHFLENALKRIPHTPVLSSSLTTTDATARQTTDATARQVTRVLNGIAKQQALLLKVTKQVFHHVILPNGDAEDSDTITVQAIANHVSIVNKGYGIFDGSSKTSITVYRSRGSTLPWCPIGESSSFVEIALLLPNPLMKGDKTVLRVEIQRTKIWKRLLRTGSEDNRFNPRISSQNIEHWFHAPKGFTFTGMSCMPNLGSIQIRKVANNSVLIWKIPKMPRCEVRYTLYGSNG